MRPPSDVSKLGASVPYEDLVPEEYFRNALDLNRFSNKVARELAESYNRIIIDAVNKLEKIERMPLSRQPKYKAARLRALLAQTKKSLEGWSGKSSQDMVGVLEAVARIQGEFAEIQLAKALPSDLRPAVRSVEVTPSFAKSVVSTSPKELNASLLSDSLDSIAKGSPQSFSLTAKQGAKITLPNGEVLTKAFRGIAEKNAELLGRTIRDGLLTGQSTQEISRRLIGNLYFGEKARTVQQLASAGGELTRAANHQVTTMVRTSVQQVSNTAAQQVYMANQDVTKEYRWLATLDSRTAPECRVLDQQTFKYGTGPTPPQHFNCRCRTVAVIADHLPKRGVRPSETGLVPRGTSYGKWLNKQSASVKAKALGKKKVKYFNALAKKKGVGPDGALKKLVNSDGSERTIKQLEKAYGKQPSRTVKPKTIKPKIKPSPKSKPTTIQQLDKEIAKTKTELKTAKAKLKALEERDPTLPTIAQLQGIPEGSKIKATDVNQAFDLMDGMEGVAGENARKLRKFAEKRQVFASWSNGREATGAWSKQKEKMSYLMDNPQFKKSLQLSKKRGEKGVTDGIAPEFDPITSKFNQKNSVRARRGIHYSENGLDDVNRGMNSAYLDKFFTMKGNKGSAGYTFQGANHIVLRRETTFKPIKNLKEVRDAVKASVQNAVKGEPSQLVERLLYKRVYSKDITKPSRWISQQSWLTTYVHEMGHQIHYAANRPAMAGKQWIPSIYGKGNYMEQFAESFVQYIFDPVGLKKASPVAYKWVDDAVAAALKAPN